MKFRLVNLSELIEAANTRPYVASRSHVRLRPGLVQFRYATLSPATAAIAAADAAHCLPGVVQLSVCSSWLIRLVAMVPP